MEATHDAKTMEEGHDLDVAPGRQQRRVGPALGRTPAADANKYTRGHLNLVAGSAAYPGAACLAAAAGERAGAGYTEVFCSGEIDDHLARLAPVFGGARLESVEAGQGARAPAGSPDRLRHRLRLRRGGDVPHLASYGNGAGLGGASAHRRGRPRASRQRHRIAPGPRAGPQPGARRYSRPTAAKRRAWPEAPGEALEEAEAAAARGTRGPLEGVADTLSAAGPRHPGRGRPRHRRPWPARSPRPTAPLWPSRAR